jgi:hypothetical protein
MGEAPHRSRMQLRYAGRQLPSRAASQRWGRRSVLGPLGAMLALLAFLAFWRVPGAETVAQSGQLQGGVSWQMREWAATPERPAGWRLVMGPKGRDAVALEGDGPTVAVTLEQHGAVVTVTFRSDTAVGPARRFDVALDSDGIPRAPARFSGGVQAQ